MAHPTQGTTIQVSTQDLQHKLDQASAYLEQARYRQAARLLSDLLQKEPLSLVDQLYVLAQRALAHALWKKPEEAIEDASQILAVVKADVNDLPYDMDWEYEKAQDIGHLRFLADVLQLRGTLFRVMKAPRRAVEDLTLSAYMTHLEDDNLLNYILRAGSLIELGDCLEKAQSDLNTVLEHNPTLFYQWFDLPEVEGAQVEKQEKRLYFVSADHRIALKSDKVKIKKSKIKAHWFRLAKQWNLEH